MSETVNKTGWKIPKLSEVIEVIDRLYPQDTAEKWDSVGLISGDLNQEVKQILVAIDPVEETVDEAVSMGADLLFTHHPLFLHGTKTVASTDPKGRLIRKLILNNCALFNAHTNADKALHGVGQSLSELIPMTNTKPLAESSQDENSNLIGHGRIGEIAPITLKEFAQKLAKELPQTPAGINVAGNLQDTVTKIAYSPGAGQSMLETARWQGADVFVCADLKHHVASEFLMAGKPYLVMPTHWASEWPWVKKITQILQEIFESENYNVDVKYSTRITDPWTINTNNLEEK